MLSVYTDCVYWIVMSCFECTIDTVTHVYDAHFVLLLPSMHIAIV